MYTMPTWSAEELSCVQADKSKWYDNFALFGGVPRNVLAIPGMANPSSRFAQEFATKAPEIARTVFTPGIDMIDAFQNLMLIHINPPLTESGEK